MQVAPCPANEAERLAALHRLLILDTPADADFDIFAALAAALFDAPLAAVSLVDAERQWFKASVGFEVRETPRSISFCGHAIASPEPVFCVEDTERDTRFADNPLVTGPPYIRFYAGAPILDQAGLALGVLCVADRVPRRFPPASRELLRCLARGVGNTLRLYGSLQQMQSLATRDTLTGVSNRNGLQAHLERALAGLADDRREGHGAVRLGLLFLDLDRFKVINDLFGHAGGDTALQEVARRLQQAVRRTDFVARLGGDEFCVLLDRIDGTPTAEAVASRIHAALADSFLLAGSVVPLRTSIGIAFAPDDAMQADALIAQADAALYAAKRAGRGATRLARDGTGRQPQASKSAAPAGRRSVEMMLRAALFPPGQEPFSLRFQPIFDAPASTLLGFEALVRWPQPDGTELQPDAFIPVAEATGMIVRLDRWVLEHACQEAARWPAPLTIATNLSAGNFLSGALIEDVDAILRRTGLPARRLRLEITESVLLCDPERVRATVEGLRRLGVSIVLDDFGSGHASLAYLCNYPIDIIKIDRSFVQGAKGDERTGALLRAIIRMGQALNLRTVAEGVETREQLRLVQRKRVDAVQGFLLGRPMDCVAARNLIEEHQADSGARAGAASDAA